MSDFSQAILEMWRARIGDVEKLASVTPDGIRIEPLYQQIEGVRAAKATHGPWQVLQRVDQPDAGKANAQALDDLENGAVGLSIARAFDPLLLEGVALHAIHIRMEHGDDSVQAFARYVGKQPIDPSRLHVSFGLKDSGLIMSLLAQGFSGPFMDADGRTFHSQGATDAQELGCVLSGLVRALREHGNTMPSATLSANQDMFLTLAKFRAVRILWARILEASGLPFARLQLHGETSPRMMATLDPHMNLLRATTAVFGAGLGGCDSFTVLPFSIKQGVPNAFARRMARNTQLILLEEAQLWRVADAASGSGYVESLTHQLCEKAWEIFQDIERTGKLPAFDASNTASDPIVGSSTHQLKKEFAAAVDALS
jgi:methylmalonyl-CoA mutase